MSGLNVSPVNTNARDTDGLNTVSSATQLGKKAVTGSSVAVSGGDNVAVQEVGTHLDDAAFGIASGTVSAAAFLADATSPDSVDEGDVGVARMTLARKQIVVSSADAAAVTNVASQDTNITLLAANVNRIGALIFNDDTGPLYVKFGATATATTSYTVKIAAGGYYELPQPVYRGIIDGIWTTSGSGNALLTELT